MVLILIFRQTTFVNNRTNKLFDQLEIKYLLNFVISFLENRWYCFLSFFNLSEWPFRFLFFNCLAAKVRRNSFQRWGFAFKKDELFSASKNAIEIFFLSKHLETLIKFLFCTKKQTNVFRQLNTVWLKLFFEDLMIVEIAIIII